MTFPEAPAGIRLPQPDAERHYLLYLHVPFCVVLCPFCSFHRVEFKEDRTRQYFSALRKEIRQVTDTGYRFGQLYVGGGTPTVLPDELISTIELIGKLHPMKSISIETNPDDLDGGNLPGLREVGVNRLSVGVQSFDDTLLQEMQRYDKYGSGDDIRRRLKHIAGMFDTLNVDMIFNFPHQTEASLDGDLKTLTDELGVDQVSFYPLMTAKTAKNLMRREMGEVDYSREKTLYKKIVEHMLDAGYVRSSAWCFSRQPGMFDEYIVKQEEYLGLGSGAFSYLQGSLYASTFSINHYLRLVDAGRIGVVRQREMTTRDQMRYYLLMHLFGGSLDKAAAEARFAGQFRRRMLPEITGLRLIGAITDLGDRIALTESGYQLWVVLMREFFTGINNYREDMRHNISREAEILPVRHA